MIDSTVVESLREALKGSDAQLLVSGDDGYDQSIKRWSDTSEKRAGVVVKPLTADETSIIVKFAGSKNIPFTVCGGGHSTNGASAASEDGLVIDLSRMRTVTVDPEAMTISAGGGCVWKDVDVEAGKYNLATVGGSVNHTGIGGLTLGGGYGWLTARYGLVIDNLLAATVVLADGSIVKSSKNEHEELFWALRGAGHSFGVVTEFVYQAHKQENTVFAGLVAFTPEKLPNMIEFVNWFQDHCSTDEGIIFGFGGVKRDMKPVVVAALYYNGSEEDGRRFFGPLLAMDTVVNTTRQMPYCELNGILNPTADFGGRKTFSSGNFRLPLQLDFMQELFEDFQRYNEETKDAGESLVLFEVWPYKKVLEKSNDTMAFANRGDFYTIITVFKCYDQTLDAHLRKESKAFTEKISNRAGVGKGRTDTTKDGVGHYGNYLESGENFAVEKVYGKNAARLQAAKLTYDPKNLFRKVVSLLPAN